MKIQLVEAKKQKVWGWPAVINFVLGGTAAAFYVLGNLVVMLPGCSHIVFLSVTIHLLPPVLVGLGFVCLTVEVGRPFRGHQMFRRVYNSRMSQESMVGIAFIFFAIFNWISPHPILTVLAVAAAMGLIISQGFIVYGARAVTAWNVPIIPLLFVTSGFAAGGGLLLATLRGLTYGLCAPLIGLICAFVNLVVWIFYLHWSHDPDFRKATEALRSPKSLIITLGIGHLFPVFVLLSILVAFRFEIGIELPGIATPMMGLAMIAGSVIQKAEIILKAGYQKGIALDKQESLPI